MIGNDVFSRIEGANPLYLPQTKVYDRCCSVGPCVSSTGTITDPHDLDLTMHIERDGETVFDGESSTGEMVRTCKNSWNTTRDTTASPNSPSFSQGLLSETSLVPEDGFDLQPSDTVDISTESIGALSNGVTIV